MKRTNEKHPTRHSAYRPWFEPGTSKTQLLPYRTVTVWCISNVVFKYRYLGTAAERHTDAPPHIFLSLHTPYCVEDRVWRHRPPKLDTTEHHIHVLWIVWIWLSGLASVKDWRFNDVSANIAFVRFSEMEYRPNSSLHMDTPNTVSGSPSIERLLICPYSSRTLRVLKCPTLCSSRYSGNQMYHLI